MIPSGQYITLLIDNEKETPLRRLPVETSIPHQHYTQKSPTGNPIGL